MCWASRAIARALVAAALLTILPSHLHAQAELTSSYPKKLVRIIVPFAAGSVTDALTRVIAQNLSDRIAQPVIIDNKPGASGNLGAELVAKSLGDGHTLLMATGNHTINMTLYRNLNYDTVKDLAPIIFCASPPRFWFHIHRFR